MFIGSTDDGHTFVVLNRRIRDTARLLTEAGFLTREHLGRTLYLLPPGTALDAHERAGIAMYGLLAYTHDLVDLAWTTRQDGAAPSREPDVAIRFTDHAVSATAATGQADAISSSTASYQRGRSNSTHCHPDSVIATRSVPLSEPRPTSTPKASACASASASRPRRTSHRHHPAPVPPPHRRPSHRSSGAAADHHPLPPRALHHAQAPPALLTIRSAAAGPRTQAARAAARSSVSAVPVARTPAHLRLANPTRSRR